MRRTLARARDGKPLDLDEATVLLHARGDDLDTLLSYASRTRDAGLEAARRPGIITYSRKVFIPLTRLCRDRCGYCTFATVPHRLDHLYLEPDEVLDIARAGSARVKRVIYPAGFRWSTHIKPIVGTDLCMHAHVGFLAHGQIHIEYADGCISEFAAPQVVAIEPGHEGWVVGTEPAVLIEFDFENETARMCGMPERHAHGD